LLAGEVVADEWPRQEVVGDADGAIVFDEAVGRPVGDIGAEVSIEAARDGAAGDGLSEHLFPNRQLFGLRRGIALGRLFEKRSFRLRNRPIPAQVPLADTGGLVALLFGECADGHAVGCDERALPEADDAALQARAPVVATGE